MYGGICVLLIHFKFVYWNFCFLSIAKILFSLFMQSKKLSKKQEKKKLESEQRKREMEMKEIAEQLKRWENSLLNVYVCLFYFLHFQHWLCSITMVSALSSIPGFTSTSPLLRTWQTASLNKWTVRDNWTRPEEPCLLAYWRPALLPLSSWFTHRLPEYLL